MSPKRGDRAAPPPQPGEWDVRFADNDSAKGWEESGRQAPGNTLEAWKLMRTNPSVRSNTQRHEPLEFGLSHRLHAGRLLPQWQIEVTGGQAAMLSTAGRNLAQPAGLAIETSEVVVEVALGIAAADATAEAAIAVDTAINAGVSDGSAAAVVHARLAEDAARLPYEVVGALGATKVVERAWQLGHYRLAYALRERDDFDYA